MNWSCLVSTFCCIHSVNSFCWVLNGFVLMTADSTCMLWPHTDSGFRVVLFFLWGKFRLSHPLPSLVMGVFLGHQTDQTAPLPPASPHSLPPSPTSPPVFVHLSHHPSCLPLLFLFPPLCFLYFALISILFPYSLNLNCYSLCLAQPKVMLYSSM